MNVTELIQHAATPSDTIQIQLAKRVDLLHVLFGPDSSKSIKYLQVFSDHTQASLDVRLTDKLL